MFLVSLSSLFHKSRTIGKKLSLYDLVRHWGEESGVSNHVISIIFMFFPLFIKHRIQHFNSLRKFQDVLNLDILLKGSPLPTVEENTEIFDAVHQGNLEEMEEEETNK
jgi:hypothetical protein